MTKEERKQLMLERKKTDKMITIERKAQRRTYSKNGGRF